MAPRRGLPPFDRVGATAGRLATIAQPIDIPDAPDARRLIVSSGVIDLADVSHHYGRGGGGIDRISLRIGAGEKVGLVGRSGAGKSTLVNLIPRFFAAESGRITIDGQDLAGVTQESLRARSAWWLRTPTLLHRSVRDNITFGREDLPPEAIDAAVRKAAADRFIPGLVDREGRKATTPMSGSGASDCRAASASASRSPAPSLRMRRS